jgi:hypothetical protein
MRLFFFSVLLYLAFGSAIHAHGLNLKCNSCNSIRKDGPFTIYTTRSVYNYKEHILITGTIRAENDKPLDLRSLKDSNNFNFHLRDEYTLESISFCLQVGMPGPMDADSMLKTNSSHLQIFNFRHFEKNSFVGISEQCPLKPGRYIFSIEIGNLKSNLVRFDVRNPLP